MPEIKISDGKSGLNTAVASSGSAIKNASDTIGNITTLLAKATDLASHVENVVSMFRGKEGAGSSIIQSKGTAPPVTTSDTMQAPQGPPRAAPGVATQNVSDQNMEAYFSSPEGLKKIADAIDKMVPLIGDLKLSEVKQAIMTNIAPGEKPQKTKSKGGKKK